MPLVVEWAPGVTPKPDRVTLGRHVKQLVEVRRGPWGQLGAWVWAEKETSEQRGKEAQALMD